VGHAVGIVTYAGQNVALECNECYEIIYDKQFVKVTRDKKDSYIPMVLGCSSNCYDWNHRRERSWFPISLNQNILTDKSLAWADTKYFSPRTVDSLLKRIPMHEPWALHENQAPQLLKPADTDREA
jgi:hypothetical protein